MTSIHSSDLTDEVRNMYVFTKDVISEELLLSLETYNTRTKAIEYTEHIQLIPGYRYFISSDNLNWSYKEMIYITQEQVDKFLVLYKTLDMSFLDYIELALTK